jgi:PAS domain S-box-containing protein
MNPRPHPTRTALMPVEQLDLATVLKVVRALSSEADLESLIATILRLGLEHAAAERGLLILARGDAYRIEAEAEGGAESVRVAPRQSFITSKDLPQSALEHVLRTGETVLLHDASSENRFPDDDYLRGRRARSVLCMPLLKQARLVGVIYLENNRAAGAFTPARVAFLELLASEAAVSLENARLYRDLQEGEARVRRLVDANIIGIFLWHADGRVFDANEEFVRIIGHSREDLASGRVRWTDFTLPEWREDDARVMEELRGGGAAKAQERELLRKDGARVPVLTGGTLFEGSTDEGVAFVVDLTERKQAEQALHEREREARQIVDTIPGLVAILTPAGEVDAVNSELVEYCGQPLEAMKQWGTNGTVHPEDVPRIVPLFTQGITSGQPYDFEARIRRFDGVYRWNQVRGLPLRDTSGQVLRWYVALFDIEDRKRAEQELRQAYSHLAEAQRLSKTGSFITDPRADERDWSEEAFRIFEFDPASRITHQAIRQVVHPEDLPVFDAAFKRAAEGGEFDLAFRITTSAGNLKHIHAVGHVMDQVAGRALFIGAIQDVTESRVAQEALDRARSELAHVSRVTTISALTASIAHEVNQPLSGIITNASTCLRMLDAEPPNIDGARETARRTIRDGNRASDVITRLRALFSKREPTLEPMDLNEAMREVIALSLGDLQRKRVALQLELAEELPSVNGDRIQLQQVILNLVRNASEAMLGVDDRPRELVIRSERESGDRVRVTVRDAGVGLDRESGDKLFDAFYTTKRGGMGIGLSVSRSIVERHHGRLWAEPNEGPGVTFAFSIPRAPEDAPAVRG